MHQVVDCESDSESAIKKLEKRSVILRMSLHEREIIMFLRKKDERDTSKKI
jgi:hypothetical protein